MSGAARPPRHDLDAPMIGNWLHIDVDGTVIVFTGKAEVGQNIRTSLAQAVAEELRLPLDAIRLVMADTDLTPYDAGTFGSRTTPIMAAHLHKVAATLREVLIDRAAEQWNVDRSALDVVAGAVRHPPSGREIRFETLTQGRRVEQPIDDAAPVTPVERRVIARAPRTKTDGQAFVTGEHRYTSDLVRPDMLHGMVLRPPRYGARLLSLDTRAAEALPDVTVIHTDDIVGVAAPTRQRAIEALGALHADWSTPEPQPSAREIFTFFKEHPAPPPDEPRPNQFTSHETGDIEAGLEAADHVVEHEYTVAYVAHAPMEPRAAVAEWNGDRLTVWTGTQRPFGVREELRLVFGLPEENIRVVVPDTGGAFGGKHTGEVAVEAARLARAVGRPTKLVWTREEEFTWAYFRPAGVIAVTGAVRADGTLSAWEFHNYNSGAAGIQTPYAVVNQRLAFHPTLAPLRQGSYRALAATANHFARETHMDALARTVGMDPLVFRLHNLRDERLRAVLTAATEAFGWGQTRPPDHGFGIAGGTEKGSYVATCAEVVVEPRTREVRVTRVVQAFECGAIVNPNGLRNQVEGAIVQGLGGALFEAIDFADGSLLNGRFSAYRVPRFADMPTIEVVLVDRSDLPAAGGSETPIIGIAPAIANAIGDATGVHLRALPLAPNGVLPNLTT